MLLAHGVVEEVLVEATVADGGGEGDGAGEVFGDTEAVANELAATGLECVVVGEDAVVPDLVEVVELALFVDDAVGEGVGGGVEAAVGLEESGFGEGFAGCVLDGEVYPGFVEVALFGDEGVADAFVLDDDVGGDGFSGCEGEAGESEGSDEDGVGWGGLSGLLFESEDVDVEDAFAKEGDGFVELLIIFVVLGH